MRRILFRSELGGARSKLMLRSSGLVGVSRALLVASIAFAKFGSSYDDTCNTLKSSQCVANNEFHTVYVNVPAPYPTEVRWAMSNYNAVAPPIQMTEVFAPALDKDVEVLLTNAGANNALAWSTCASGATYGGTDAAHDRWCRPQRLYYNTYYAAGWFPLPNNKRYIACHELGHTIGLRHPAAGETTVTCMKPATITPKNVPTYTTTSGVERSQVDAFYPH